MGYLVLKKAANVELLLAGTMPYIQVTKAEQKQELLGVETFTITVESVNPINFEVGDSIDAFGRRYWINSPQNIAIADLGDKLVYDIQLEGVQYRLINAVLFDMGVSQYATSTEVIYNANLLEIARLIVTCANFNEGRDMFTLDEANIPQTKRFTFTFSDTNCLAALQTICGKDYFNMLFKLVEQPNDTYILRIGAIVGENQPYSFAVGQMGGAYDIRRAKGENSGAMFTRLFAFGSSENIATAYRGYSPKLRLPSVIPPGYSFPVDKNGNPLFSLVNDTNRNLNYIQVVGAAQHISSVKTYTDIKPHRTGIVTGSDVANINRFYDTAMDFDLNERLANGETKYLLNGQSAKIHFNTGKLAGLEFDASYNHETNCFTLASYTDDKSQTFPDPKSTAFRVSEDDEYVILNINMPTSYVDAAEKELLIAAVKDMQDSLSPANKYSLRVRELYLKKFENPGEEKNFFNTGDFVHVVDKTLNLDSKIQILSFTRSWLKPYEYSLELSDVVTISYITQMIGKLEAITNVVAINKLDNPARTKRNWRVSEELASMIDSVRTDMLLVGNPAGQYDTNIKFEFNYGGNPNRVVSTAGVLVHSVYSGGLQNGEWSVGSSVEKILDDLPRYVYIKAGVSDDTASIVFSETEIDVESVPGFYHFPYCILSTVFDGFRTATKFKGRTQIIGDEVTTGHIRGNALDISLNDGYVKGIIKFKSGDEYKDIEEEMNNLLDTANGYSDTVLNYLQSQIDNVVDSWFFPYDPSLNSFPANEWMDNTTKNRHIGDTFTNTSKFISNETTPNAGKSWRFVKNSGVYSWAAIADNDAILALLMASKAQDTADGKRRIFLSQPTTPYDKGDLWITSASAGAGDLKKCVQGRVPLGTNPVPADHLTGTFSTSDWVLATKYTDDSALNTFITGAYAANLLALNNQVDKKAETFYQEGKPHLEILNGDDPADIEDNKAFVGDMWYQISTRKTFVFKHVNTGTTTDWTYPNNYDFKWFQMDVPLEMFDLADGKRTIYVLKPTKGYKAGDIWIFSVNDTATTVFDVNGDFHNHVCVPNELLVAKQDSNGVIFSSADWKVATKYTDDSALNAFIDGDYRTKLIEIKNQVDKKANTYYQSELPHPEAEEIGGGSLYDEYVGDLWYCSANSGVNAQKTFMYKKFNFTTNDDWTVGHDADFRWVQMQIPKEVFDIMDGKKSIYVNQPFTPYHQGDLWAQGVSGEIYVCNVERLTGAFNSSDWGLASKYTDDSTFLNALIGGDNLIFNSTFTLSAGYNYFSYRTLYGGSGTSFAPPYLKNGKKYVFSVGSVTKISGDAYGASIKLYDFANFADTQHYILNFQQTRQEVSFEVPEYGNWSLIVYAGIVGSTAYNVVSFTKLMLQEGTKGTAFTPAIQYLTDALGGSTETVGGLTIGNMIAVKKANETIVGGINGGDIPGFNDIRMWFGKPIGQMNEAPFKVYENGKVFIGNENSKREVSVTPEPLLPLSDYINQAYTPIYIAGEPSISRITNPNGMGAYEVVLHASESDPYNTSYAFTLTQDALVRLDLIAVTTTSGINNYDLISVSSSVLVKRVEGYDRITVLSKTVNGYLGTAILKGKYYLPAGTYVVELHALISINPYSSYSPSAYIQCSIGWADLRYSYSPSKTVLSSNGIACVRDEWSYFYMTQAFEEYYLRAKGAMEFLSPNGLFGFRIKDTGVYKIINGVETPLT